MLNQTVIMQVRITWEVPCAIRAAFPRKSTNPAAAPFGQTPVMQTNAGGCGAADSAADPVIGRGAPEPITVGRRNASHLASYLACTQLGGAFDAEVLVYLAGRVGAIERVKVNSADVVVKQVRALLGRPQRSDARDGIVVGAA